MELKVGETVSSHLSVYTSLIEVAAAALGGKDDKSKGPKEPITEDLSQATPEHFQARMASLMSL